MILKCSCIGYLNSFVNLDAASKQSVTLATFEYRNEPMFHCKMTKLDYGKYFALFFTGVEVERNMGFKIAEVTYSILEVGLERHKMEAKCTRFDKHIQLFKACPPKEIDETFEIVFYVKLGRATRNFEYQLVDAISEPGGIIFCCLLILFGNFFLLQLNVALLQKSFKSKIFPSL